MTDEVQIDGLAAEVLRLTNGRFIDGLLHCVAFGRPKAMLNIMGAPKKDIFTTLDSSAISFAELARGVDSILNDGARIVAISADPSKAFPAYNWMNVAKAMLE